MNLMRIFPDFGMIVKLVSVVFIESGSFLTFYFYWLFNFNMFKLLLGTQPDMKDYPGVSPTLASFLIEYRNSVGDINPPTYDYWQEDVAGAGLMVNLNQSYFMIFQLFMNVVLLNFLIAIISQSYEQVNSEQELHLYMQKAEFNLETANLFETISKVYKSSNILISTTATTSSHEANSEWKGIVKTIKTMFNEESKIQNEKAEQVKQDINLIKTQLKEQSDKTDQILSLLKELKETN